MRILLVLANGGRGGMQRRVADLAAALNDAGAPTSIAVGAPIDGDIFPEGYLELPAFDRRLAGGPRFIAALRHVVRSTGADVVHGRGLRLAPALRLAAGRRRVAVTAAGMPAGDVKMAARLLKLSRVPVSSIGPDPIAQLAAFGITAELLPNAFREPPPPVDRTAICHEAGIDPAMPLAVAAGRFVPQKDPCALIEVLARAERWNLIMCGDGPLRSEVDDAIERAGISDRVRLLGWRYDAQSIVGAADAMLSTARWEGQGGALVESMASGVPIVSTACPGVVEWVDDGRSGLLAPLDDPAALAAQLDRLLDEPALRDELVREGRATASPHIGERSARRYLEYYDSLRRARSTLR